MSAILGMARSGAWLDRTRATVYPALLLAGYLFAILVMAFASPDGRNDLAGRPLGTDFSNVYAAGTYVLEGRAEAPFDPETQYRREQAIFGDATPFFGWHYPPFFLGLAALFALLPYAAALVAWQASSFALYLAAIRGTLGRALTRNKMWWLIAAAYPAVFVNLGHGHNGFLTAALLGGGLVLLDRKPILAGILIGLLAYKPQFGLLIPVALIAGGHWRAILSALATVAAIAAACTMAFGMGVWTAFLNSMTFTRVEVLEKGGTGWHKIQTVFSAIRMWGGSVDLAYAAQGLTTLALAATLVAVWRSRADRRLKYAALAVAAVLGTPYSLDYDMMALAIPLALLASYGLEHGFRPWAISFLAFVWLTPLIARAVALVAFIPMGCLVMIALFAVIVRWALPGGAGASATGHAALSPV